MAHFIGASTRCSPWGLWIWFKDGRDYETACRFDRPEDAENYARNRLADSDEVDQFALLRRRPGKRDHVKIITRKDLPSRRNRYGPTAFTPVIRNR
jgi:hypothetical protein